jgi:hypothetical protein
MVGQLLGPVLGPVRRQGLQPAGRPLVLVGPGRPGQLPVGDVADQDVAEGVLALPGDRRTTLAAQQLPALQGVQAGLQGGRFGIAEGGHGPQPADLAEHGRVLHQPLVLGGEGVQAGGDDALNCLGQGQLVGPLQLPGRPDPAQEPPVGQHAHVLLGIQGVAPGPGQQGRLQLGREQDLAEQAADQPGGVGLAERGQRDGGRVGLAAAPAGPAGQQLRAGGGHDQQRHLDGPVHQVVEEVQQDLIRPVQVLHHQHGGALLGQRLQEPPPAGERLPLPLAAQLPGALQPHERTQVSGDPGRLLTVADHVGDGPGELGLGRLGRIGFEDAGLGLDDLAQRPQRHPLPIRKAAALPPGGQLRLALDQLQQLEHQPALAHPGDPDQGHQLGGLLGAGPGQGVRQQPELPIPADQGGSGGLGDVHPQAGPRRQRLPHPDRVRLALGRHRLRLAVLDRPFGGPEGALVDQDPVGRGGGLQPGSGVDHVPRGHPLALDRSGVQHHQRLPGGHPHPHMQIQRWVGLVELGDRLADSQGGPHRPLRVVLVGDRSAEQRHHRVPDELLHRPPIALQVGPQPSVVGGEQAPDVLDVQPLRPAGEPDQVAKQHADDLAFLPSGQCRSGQRRRTAQAEPGPLGIVLTTALTDRHPGIVGAGLEPVHTRSVTLDHKPQGCSPGLRLLLEQWPRPAKGARCCRDPFCNSKTGLRAVACRGHPGPAAVPGRNCCRFSRSRYQSAST